MPAPAGRSPATRVSDRVQTLNAHPFLANLDKSIIAQIAPHAVFRRARKDTVVFRKGDDGSTLYLLLKGAIRISSTSVSGKSGSLLIVFPGEIFGAVGMFDGGRRISDAIAMEDSEMVGLVRRHLLPVLRANPDLALRLIETLSRNLRHVSEQVEDIAGLSLSGRLAKALLYLDGHCAGQKQSVRITQSLISQMVGAARESTNKQLQVWRRMDILSIESTGVVVRKPHMLRC
jgi:CRP/FNR family cyclic AMP-dependent transcriptional regulator